MRGRLPIDMTGDPYWELARPPPGVCAIDMHSAVAVTYPYVFVTAGVAIWSYACDFRAVDGDNGPNTAHQGLL